MLDSFTIEGSSPFAPKLGLWLDPLNPSGFSGESLLPSPAHNGLGGDPWGQSRHLLPKSSSSRIKIAIDRLDQDITGLSDDKMLVGNSDITALGRKINVRGKKDTIRGTRGKDVIDASNGKGKNRLLGLGGNDTLIGGKGDRLDGGKGNDTLVAGKKSRQLQFKGGAGDDLFKLFDRLAPQKSHTILDFDVDGDRLWFRNASTVSVNQNGSNTIVIVDGKAIAQLRQVSTQTLTQEQFIFIGGTPDLIGIQPDDNPTTDNPTTDNPTTDNPTDDNPTDDNPTDDNPTETIDNSTLGQALLLSLESDGGYQDTLDTDNDAKYYKFNLINDALVTAYISDLSANANLQLIRDRNNNGAVDNGEIIKQSASPGTSPESIVHSLDAGEYYLRVYPEQTGTSISYNLNLETDSEPVTAEFAITDNNPMSNADDGSVIDIMVVYTAEARQAQGGTTAMNNLIQATIDDTNQIYQNSGVLITLRLVHTAEVNYAESGSSNTDLYALQGTSDGYMDEVHQLRNTYGADLVSLFVNDFRDGNAGLAFLMSQLSASFESLAFSVVEAKYAKDSAFSHEVGHNLGASHDRDHAQTPGVFDYSYGYITPTQIGDVMSYAHTVPGGEQVKYFSSPNLTVRTGEALGIDGQADVVRTFNQTRFIAANFRQSVIPGGGNSTKPTISINATDPTASEINQNEGEFTFTRSGNTTNAMTVYYTISGTASNGADYVDANTNGSLTGSVSFAPNSSTAKVTLKPLTDSNYFEGYEAVTFSLSTSLTYTLGSANNATITIEDDNNSSGVSLYYFSYSYGNGDYYWGYFYDEANAYSVGQYPGYGDGFYNETGYDGYYYISDVYDNYGSSYDLGKVYIYSYYDGDYSGQYYEPYGWVYSQPSGVSGLGSEYDWVFDSYWWEYVGFGYDYYQADAVF